MARRLVRAEHDRKYFLQLNEVPNAAKNLLKTFRCPRLHVCVYFSSAKARLCTATSVTYGMCISQRMNKRKE